MREPRPCMYWLEQHARGPDGVRRRRAGLIAALRLEPYAPGRVRRHERTLDGPKAGRLAVLRAVRANLSPIFMAYGDPSRRISETFEPLVAERAPIFETTDEEGTTHRLWRVCEDEPLRVAIDVVGSRPLTIIDGHHRYETALAYRDERRAADGDPAELQAYDFAPVYLANRHDPGLVLFPTHRVVSGIDPRCGSACPSCSPSAGSSRRSRDVAALERRIVAPPRGLRTFGLVRGERRSRRCTPACAASAPTALDVVAVGTLVLRDLLGLDAAAVATTDRIAYRQGADDARRSSTPPRRHGGRAARARAERRRRRGRGRCRPDDAAQVDVLLPEDPRRHGLQPARPLRPVTADGLARDLPRDARRRRAAVAAVPRARRADELGRGAGGDMTVADRPGGRGRGVRGADARVRPRARASRSSRRRSASERSAAAGRWRVVIDPIDGSLNAKRGPAAVCALGRDRRRPDDGRRRARLRLRPRQRRGVDRAARRRGDRRRRRLGASRPQARLQLVALEATRPEHLAPAAAALPGEVERVRVLGSLALALCHLADGRARRGREPAPERRALDRHRRGAAGDPRGRRGRRAARRRRARSAQRRSTSSAARASSRRATTSPWRASPALLGIGTAAGSARIRASMPS